jgi:hypothetical protein
MNLSTEHSCGSAAHLSRRTLLKWGALGGMTWLTPLARTLARAEEKAPRGKPAKAVILLWMTGGPSQLETFDPHPGKSIAHGAKSIKTAQSGVLAGEGLDQIASLMKDITLVRSVVSKEADHERAVYNVKTGYRPNPTVIHPSIGAVICHQLPEDPLDIPRHISILPENWPARGGYLGAQYDAFQVYDPQGPIQDVSAQVEPHRMNQRMSNLAVVEKAFAVGRPANLESNRTLHQFSMSRALKIMSSAQLSAFDVKQAPASQRAAYGDTPFGRSCLAALRLIETGVRCVEVTLSGWDTHVNNHKQQQRNIQILDPAFAALLRDLKQRNLVGLHRGPVRRRVRSNSEAQSARRPRSLAVRLQRGDRRGRLSRQAMSGERPIPKGEKKEPADPVRVEDLHATIQHSLGINPEKELITPVGRPLTLSDGRILRDLLRVS